jgi:hypothetical protein
LCFVSVFGFHSKIVNHGGRPGNTVWALARWQHLVASHEATDALHRAMRIAPYHPGGMRIEIVINLPAFFVIVDLLLPITIAKSG